MSSSTTRPPLCGAAVSLGLPDPLLDTAVSLNVAVLLPGAPDEIRIRRDARDGLIPLARPVLGRKRVLLRVMVEHYGAVVSEETLATAERLFNHEVVRRNAKLKQQRDASR